ncbi:MAG: 2-oxoacid:acceptor oxidoreductase family protein [Caldisericota bacterium]|nr:2-oxoacid:acceptor oxidoreductase family protein [Caldisericota bacterium]
MEKKLIIAGFGGQGVMLTGELLAEAGKEENKYVTFLPSYGPEMRGGTANCEVIISDEPIASPIISYPEAAIILNLPSLDKFEPAMKKNGLLILNKSLIPREVKRNDLRVIEVDAQTIAKELGNEKAANMILLGVYVTIEKSVSLDSVKNAMKLFLKGKKEKFILANEKALEKGAGIAKEFLGGK